MKDTILKIANISIEISLGNCEKNTSQIIEKIEEQTGLGTDIVIFSRNVISGHSLGDLFYNQNLIINIKESINKIKRATEGRNLLVAFSAIVDNLKNEVLFLISRGEIQGVFSYDKDSILPSELLDKSLSSSIIKCGRASVGFVVSNVGERDFLEKLNAIDGSDIVVQLACTKTIISSAKSLFETISSLSNLYNCHYIYNSCGNGESSTDYYYGGEKIAAENGRLVYADTSLEDGRDFTSIVNTRIIKKVGTAKRVNADLHLGVGENVKKLEEYEVSSSPFIDDSRPLCEIAKDAIEIQARALAKRVEVTGAKKLILGVSGGLDSTLALIVSYECMKFLGRPSKDILAITLPCFATSDRTYHNARKLFTLFEVESKEIDIKEAVKNHLFSLGHDGKTQDTTYENAQARERTQILMDLANMHGGLVVGTGDLSEVALGFSTYNGDHMSSYSVNASLPKTLMRVVVLEYARYMGGSLYEVLEDIVLTPISPELKGGEEDKQRTEDIVGPYELIDFFIYYHVLYGLSGEEMIFLCKAAFKNNYTTDTIKKWLGGFYRRFFANQFKRSCSVDGPMVTEVSLSPRGGLNLPSDLDYKEWLEL